MLSKKREEDKKTKDNQRIQRRMLLRKQDWENMSMKSGATDKNSVMTSGTN
jgi:hypothetical protein